MNFQQLNHLLSIVETGSFSKSAEKLHLTQSALSRSIHILEQELEVRLFDRIGKRNELTSFGKEVAARAKRIVLEASELKRSAELLSQGESGTLTVALGAAPSALITSRLITYMLNNFPRVQMEVLQGDSDALLAKLRAREVDAIIVSYRSIKPHDDIEIDIWNNFPSGFVCRAGHPLQNSNKLIFDDIIKFPLVSTALSDETARGLLDSTGHARHPNELLQVECQDISRLLEVVSSTDAIFLGVLASAQEGIRKGDFVELKVNLPIEIGVQFVFVTLANRTKSPILHIAQDFCRELSDSFSI
ncbi:MULTISPECIES: LysR family transcriptional regulator [Pseudomonas]|uniref:LysR family transcriptional regulator n=1 Tax=Pseudomonas vancouverensis TaxID=95300 RepID=A0A1H2MD91_PSEVA|nr:MULTISPECIES: LysR family transcriptional regulator [Pseudomonas]KAB0499114.1 LysR family transcriptional regulator [Pseudomonas vancouverensis]TDB57810.1 LysR family transcriptional regulator [Pseudomonas vancouverensis]SDU91159.1 DNA-binding transcriptional regulator, LysR family [Pseudomonas vancouverensis]